MVDHRKHLLKTAKINRKNMTLLPQCLSRRILATPLSSTLPPHYNTTIRTATRRTMIPISICSRFHHIPPPAHHLLVFNSSAKPPNAPRSRSAFLSVAQLLMPRRHHQCKGGQSLDRGLSFHISENGDFATWKCSSVECGWAGQVLAEDIASCNRVKVNCTGLMTVESLRLVPVGEKLISYFAERKISEDVLQRNAVMQISGNQNAIAFTYRRNEVLVTCKYRSLDKKFWQEKCKERIFYGLDDIKGADEIIIVEGEIDKLSMEESGFLNCVSVPDGAPAKVSAKLPSLEKDSGFQYLWNCKEHLDKASRIILATDGDPPGNALAEELARRLGRERCWRVRWPKKGEFSYYKDANEVLMNLGSAALRDVVHSAELYSMHN